MDEANPGASSPDQADSANIGASSPGPQGKRRLLRKLGIAGLGFVLFMGLSLGVAEYYTSQPEFCGTCHIMVPYYESWNQDLHGTKLGVKCVECHYAPGEQHTLMAKFRGFSQLTSYFSGRAGAGRPRAHVNDASCLTSECHGDRAHVNKSLAIGEVRKEKRIVGDQEVEIERRPTVRFVHTKHLDVGDRLADTTRQLEALHAQLGKQIPEPVFGRLTEIAVSVAPASDRAGMIRELLATADLQSVEPAVLEMDRLQHRVTRLRQLAGLNCAACHSYDATGKNHLAVNPTTCFTCHFTHQTFNHDTGACLTCHEPPTRQIMVHEQASAQKAGPALMNHQEVVERNIDCASCHLDVIQGQARVTARDCESCHDQQRYLEGFATRTLETVEEYHRVHVAAQRARCEDCHHVIEHRLIEPTLVATDSGFVKPVLDNCQFCHPNHHHQQVDLLMGTGGAGVAHTMPNAMFGSRMNCRACHSQPGSDFKGDPLITATSDTCVACHSEDYRELFKQWMSEMETYLSERTTLLEQVRLQIAELEAAGRTIPAEVRDRVASAAHNLELVRSGNGIHNKNYAIYLMDLCLVELDQVRKTLAGSQ